MTQQHAQRVTLVSITASCIPGISTPDQLIVYKARVSNPSNQHNTEAPERLLAYCMAKGHWSVFDMADFAVEVNTSRALAPQFIRHWSFRFQEYSQRYANALEIEEVEFRMQGEGGNRQSSEIPAKLPWYLRTLVNCSFRLSRKTYNKLLAFGVSRETARNVLPLATSTRFYMKGSVRSWCHYLLLRNDQHTQKEHRMIAQEIEEVFASKFPCVYQALLLEREALAYAQEFKDRRRKQWRKKEAA